MRFGSILLLFFSLIFTLKAFPHQHVEWKIVGDEDGFRLFKADYPNSNIIGIKGETIIDYPIDRVFTVFYDHTRQKEWINRLKHVEIVEMKSFGKRIVYSQGYFPWPTTDREFLLENTCSYKKEEKQVNCVMSSVDKKLYPHLKNDDHVRAIVIDGGFQLNDVGDNKTKVAVYIHGDPKGHIPTFIVNIIQEQWPRKSIENLLKQLKKDDIVVNSHIVQWFESGSMPSMPVISKK